MSPCTAKVKAIILRQSWRHRMGTASYARNETSPAQDIESGDSGQTQRVVVLPEGLTGKDFITRYIKIICATGAKLLRCKGVGPKRRNASICTAAP